MSELGMRAPAGAWPAGWPGPGRCLLGLAGATVAALVAWSPPDLGPGPGAASPPAGRSVLVACALALLIAGLAPTGVRRAELWAAGGTALGILAVVVAAPDGPSVAVLLLLLAAVAALPAGRRPLPVRLRGPALAALLIGLGWPLLHISGAPALNRLGALGLALGIAAAAGLLPYLGAEDPIEPRLASSLVWTGFFGPVCALALLARLSVAPGPATQVLQAALLGLGLLNLAWGVVGGWRAAGDAAAWRCSFFADWGLALVGLGLPGPEGRLGAHLVLISLILVRLPLYAWARPNASAGRPLRSGALSVLAGAALVGAAPFSGFEARLLVLKAAIRLGWPLALLLGVSMLLWTAQAWRLGRTLDQAQRRAAAGLAAVLAASLALALIPSAWLGPIGP